MSHGSRLASKEFLSLTQRLKVIDARPRPALEPAAEIRRPLLPRSVAHACMGSQDPVVDALVAGQARLRISRSLHSEERLFEVTLFEGSVSSSLLCERSGKAVRRRFVRVGDTRVVAELKGNGVSDFVGDDPDSSHVAVSTELTRRALRLRSDEDFVEVDGIVTGPIAGVPLPHDPARRWRTAAIAHEPRHRAALAESAEVRRPHRPERGMRHRNLLIRGCYIAGSNALDRIAWVGGKLHRRRCRLKPYKARRCRDRHEPAVPESESLHRLLLRHF